MSNPLSVLADVACSHFASVVTTYPMMMYKMGDAYQDNPIKGIFHHLTLHDSVPFQAMLAISSKHLAGAEGQNESVQSLTHKMRALRLLNERLQSDVGGKHDGTIYAAATMAVIEVSIIFFFGFWHIYCAALIYYRNGLKTQPLNACIIKASSK